MSIQHAFVTTATGHTDNMKSWKVRGKITIVQYKYRNGINTQQTVIRATNSPTVKREEGPRR